MRIDENSLQILKKSELPSFFRVNISDNTVYIEERIEDKIYGNILVYAKEPESAFEIALEHREVIDYLLFMDKETQTIRTIAKPSKERLSIEEIFKKIGDLSNSFEKRVEQIKLSKKIASCLKDNKFGIFEAPTGTGKSLAYLIPAILHAKENSSKVVISTNTINLQRQLMEKDLPILENILDFKAKVALGRANYLCKRKLDYIFEKGNIFLFEDDSYEKLKLFSKHSKTGVKSELFDSSSSFEDSLWENVASSSLTCAHTKCPYYRNRCFYYRARAALESADIIVANHHIVLSDALIKEAKVLPEYDAIIFDEAHNLEKNATNYFTQTASTAEILRLLDKLYLKKKNKEAGFLSEISENTQKDSTIKAIKKAKKTIKDMIVFFRDISQDEITINVNNIDIFKGYTDNLSDTLLSLSIKLKNWKDNIDIMAISQSLNEFMDILNAFSENDFSQSVKWIKKTQNYVHFNITPLSINQSLQENIYNNTKSVIFTSATISVNGSFDFFKNSIGVEKADEFIAKNNFDYDTVSKLIIIGDAPAPDSINYSAAISKSVLNLAKSIKTTQIGVLVLFTSYKMLNKTHSLTSEKLEKMGFNVLKQGDFDNFETLKEFKKNRSFLFATSSFWEGIDVKGEALSVVFITRLPFEVPSTPIENSRYEIMKKQGINAFLEYSLPKAVLKFRQGFGRLIRDKKDRGVIVVSDSRIIRKSYGKMFMDSLPKLKKEVIKTDEIENSICDFFGSC